MSLVSNQTSIWAGTSANLATHIHPALLWFAVYKVLTPEQHEASVRNEYNFDHPDAIDFRLLKDTLKSLKEFKKVEVPIYNFVTHMREERRTELYGADIVIFEGIFAFHDQVRLFYL